MIGFYQSNIRDPAGSAAFLSSPFSAVTRPLTSPGKRPPEGLGSVTIASDEVAIPTAHGRKPILINPEAPGF